VAPVFGGAGDGAVDQAGVDGSDFATQVMTSPVPDVGVGRRAMPEAIHGIDAVHRRVVTPPERTKDLVITE